MIYRYFQDALKALHPEESIVAWSFRFLQKLTETISKLPSWAEICKQREEAAKKK